MRARFILALLPLVLATPAWARGTLDDILPEIRAQHPGKLSDAEPWTDSEGNTHYRIKWMTPDGRILYFNADPRTRRYSGAGGDEGGPGRDERRDDGRRNDGDGRSHWNGEQDGGGSGNSGGGDWRGQGRDGGNWRSGGNWHGGGDWGGHGGWRGGGNGGDNGGRHHRGNPR